MADQILAINKNGDSRLSPTRVLRRKEDPRLKQLEQCLILGDRTNWMIGDLANGLIDDLICSVSYLAKRYNQNRIRLNEIVKTARAFEPENRDLSIPFFRYEQARKVARRLSNTGLTPLEALREIVKTGLKSNRQISRHFAMRFQALTLPAPAGSGGIVDVCHNCDFREILPRLKTGQVHILFCDPPYPSRSGDKARKVVGDGFARHECDLSGDAEAIALTLDVLKNSQRVLAEGGVLLLCQPSGMVDYRLHQGIREFQWEVEAELIWNKGRSRPGDTKQPYSTQTEKILVLTPEGTQAKCYGKSLHSDLLSFPEVSMTRRQPRSVHVLQKPIELCQFLVNQHSPKGGLVVDAFGCSGAMTLAAIAEGRHWVYCESNQSNYDWGRHRIRELLAEKREYIKSEK